MGCVMKKSVLLVCGFAATVTLAGGVAPGQATGARQVSTDKAWIAKSNAYTQQLLDVQLKHAPERGSRQGLVQFDKLISNPTLADQLEARKELEAVLLKLKAAQAMEKDEKV